MKNRLKTSDLTFTKISTILLLPYFGSMSSGTGWWGGGTNVLAEIKRIVLLQMSTVHIIKETQAARYQSQKIKARGLFLN